MSSVFLSHTAPDKPFVRRLAKDLRSAGIVVWIDEAEMQVGMSLISEISKGIERMEYLGVVLSPASVASEWVQREVKQALTTEIRARKVKVLPMLLSDCEIPAFLSDKLYADFRLKQDYPQSLSKLIAVIGAGLKDLDELERVRRRVSLDPAAESSVSGPIFETIEQHPLTLLWRHAARFQAYTVGFLAAFGRHLHRMRGMTFTLSAPGDGEYPIAAASVHSCFTSLRSAEPVLSDHLAFCIGVCEDDAVEVKWRVLALRTFLNLCSRYNQQHPIPRFRTDRSDPVLFAIVCEPYWEEEVDPVDTLVTLWDFATPGQRSRLIESLEVLSVQTAGQNMSERVGGRLEDAIKTTSPHRVFSQLTESLCEDRKARQCLRSVFDPNAKPTPNDVLSAFRTASLRVLQEKLGPLAGEACGFLSRERIQALEMMRGEVFIHRVLTSVLADSLVHPSFSMHALARIGEDQKLILSLEALDDAAAAFLRGRMKGRAPSAVDFVCARINEGALYQRPAIALLELMRLCLFKGSEFDGCDKRIMELITRPRGLPKRYIQYLRGKLTYEEIEKEVFGAR